MTRLQNHAIFAVLGLAGAVAFGTIALNRGETVNALWVVIAAVSTYLIAFRYHSLYLATQVARREPSHAGGAAE
jgi:carbon starvation protein